MSVETELLAPTTRKIDFTLNTIDGRSALGHDGLISMEVLEQNFAGARLVTDIAVKQGLTRQQISAARFIAMLRPSMYWPDRERPELGRCSVHAYLEAKEGLVVLAMTGGDGAGSYHTFIVFDRRGFKEQYADWCVARGTFCKTNPKAGAVHDRSPRQHFAVEFEPVIDSTLVESKPTSPAPSDGP